MGWMDEYPDSTNQQTNETVSTGTISNSSNWLDQYPDATSKPTVQQNATPVVNQEETPDYGKSFVQGGPLGLLYESIYPGSANKIDNWVHEKNKAIAHFLGPKAEQIVETAFDPNNITRFINPLGKTGAQLGLDALQGFFGGLNAVVTNEFNETRKSQLRDEQKELASRISNLSQLQHTLSKQSQEQLKSGITSVSNKKSSLADIARLQTSIHQLSEKQNKKASEYLSIPTMNEVMNENLPIWMKSEGTREIQKPTSELTSSIRETLDPTGQYAGNIPFDIGVAAESILPMILGGELMGAESRVKSLLEKANPEYLSKLTLPQKTISGITPDRLARINAALAKDEGQSVIATEKNVISNMKEIPKPIFEPVPENTFELIPESKGMPSFNYITKPSGLLDKTPLTQEEVLASIQTGKRTLEKSLNKIKKIEITPSLEREKINYEQTKQSLVNTLEELQRQKFISESMEENLPKSRLIKAKPLIKINKPKPIFSESSPTSTIEKLISDKAEHPELVTQIQNEMPSQLKAMMEKISSPVKSTEKAVSIKPEQPKIVNEIKQELAIPVQKDFTQITAEDIQRIRGSYSAEEITPKLKSTTEFINKFTTKQNLQDYLDKWRPVFESGGENYDKWLETFLVGESRLKKFNALEEPYAVGGQNQANFVAKKKRGYQKKQGIGEQIAENVQNKPEIPQPRVLLKHEEIEMNSYVDKKIKFIERARKKSNEPPLTTEAKKDYRDLFEKEFKDELPPAKVPTQTTGRSRIRKGKQSGSFEIGKILTKVKDTWEHIISKSNAVDATKLTEIAVKDNLSYQQKDAISTFYKLEDNQSVRDFGEALYSWMEKKAPFLSPEIVFDMVRNWNPKIMEIEQGRNLVNYTRHFFDTASGEMARKSGRVQLIYEKKLKPFVQSLEKMYPNAKNDLWDSILYAVGKHERGTPQDAIHFAENVLKAPKELSKKIQEFIDIREEIYGWHKAEFERMGFKIQDKPGVYIHDIIPEGNNLMRIWTSEGPKWSGSLSSFNKARHMQTLGFLGAQIDYAKRNGINFIASTLRNPGAGKELFKKIAADIAKKEGIKITSQADFLKYYSEDQVVKRYIKSNPAMKPLVETQTGKSLEDALKTETSTYLNNLVKTEVRSNANLTDPLDIENFLSDYVSKGRNKTYSDATFQAANTAEVHTVDVTLPEKILANELKDYKGQHLIVDHAKTLEDDLARMTIDLSSSLSNTKFLQYMKKQLPIITGFSPKLSESLQRLGNYAVGRELEPHSAITKGARWLNRAFGWIKIVTNPSTQIMNIDQLGGALASQGFRKFSSSMAKYIKESVNQTLPEGFDEYASSSGIGNAANAYTVEMTKEGSRLGTEFKNLSTKDLGHILLSMPDKTFAASDTLARRISLRMILSNMMDKTEAAELLKMAKQTDGWMNPQSLYNPDGTLIKIGSKTIEEHMDWITRHVNAMNVNYGRAGVPFLYHHPVWNLLFGMFKKYTAHQFGANVAGFSDWVGRLRGAVGKKGLVGIPEETWKILTEADDPEIMHGARELLTRTGIDLVTGGVRSLKPIAVATTLTTLIGYATDNEDLKLGKIKQDINNQTQLDIAQTMPEKFIRNWWYNGLVNALSGGVIDYSNKQQLDVISPTPVMQSIIAMLRINEIMKKGGNPETSLSDLLILNQPSILHHILKDFLITGFMYNQVYEGKADYIAPEDKNALFMKMAYLKEKFPVIREGLRLFMRSNSSIPNQVLDNWDVLSSALGFGSQKMRVSSETNVYENTQLRASKTERDTLENKLASTILNSKDHEKAMKSIMPEIIAARKKGINITPIRVWSKTIRATSSFDDLIKTYRKRIPKMERKDFLEMVVNDGSVRGIMDKEFYRQEKGQPHTSSRINTLLQIINITGQDPEKILGANRYKKAVELSH